MQLHEAFQIQRGDVVALVGAGGKTSLLLALGRELAAAGWRVLATTTTSIGTDQLMLMPGITDVRVGDALQRSPFAFVYREMRGTKVYGPPIISPLLHKADMLLVEADQARLLPLKAPFPHEPMLPVETTLVIACVSLDVLGHPLDYEHVYNLDTFLRRLELTFGTPAKSRHIARALGELILKDIPERVRYACWLNAVPEHGARRGRARCIAQQILRIPRVDRVAIGSANYHESTPAIAHEIQRRVGAIVLAAGMAKRMGRPKVLLPWTNGTSILDQILMQLAAGGVHHVIVVTGHAAEEVESISLRHGVASAHNPDFETGEMLSSLKVGLHAMPANVSAALVVLGDQPRLQSCVVQQVLHAYAEGKGDIVAPSYQMRRGHPILIDRRYWDELLALPDDGAPRDVINAHSDRIAYVNVDNDSVLNDVDTPEDYDEARRKAGLTGK
jgi:molybdenum cofactor cytidylyltransferase